MTYPTTTRMIPRKIAIVALLIVFTAPYSAVATDFECHENCSSCNGPGEYECTVCETGFCMEDEQYRITFYEGEGRCWNITCTEEKNSGPLSAVSMLNWAMIAFLLGRLLVS